MKQPQPETMTPGQQVLHACADAYQLLREFKGSAAVISQKCSEVNPGETNTRTSVADASFDFVRGQHFNIEGHLTSHNPFSILSTPQKTKIKWKHSGQEKTEDAESIGRAVASFTGVAATAPTTIPALLLDSNWGFPFFVHDDAVLKGHEVFGGHDCFVVQQSTTRPGSRTLWIDSKTFLLRGMRDEEGAHSLDIPARLDEKQIPAVKRKFLFSNKTCIFSIERTLPSEEDLAEVAKPTVATLQREVEADH